MSTIEAQHALRTIQVMTTPTDVVTTALAHVDGAPVEAHAAAAGAFMELQEGMQKSLDAMRVAAERDGLLMDGEVRIAASLAVAEGDLEAFNDLWDAALGEGRH